MKEVKRLQALVKKAIEEVELERQPATLYEPISYTMNLGGKRMRPVLLLLAVELAGGQAKKALNPAAGIELFHNFTLLHDDIMDAAPLRRGQPTVYQKYNTDTAILAGDVMMVMAHRYMMKVDAGVVQPVLRLFHDTAINVCEGQQYDLNFEASGEVSVDDYLEMIRLKTAVLIGGSMSIGALIAGRDEPFARALGQVGESLGLAFQMQDDILDSFGDPQKFGKLAGGDILQNKKTYLLLKALDKATPGVKAQLSQWMQGKAHDATEKVAAVKAIYEKTGAHADAVALRDQYYNRAVTGLQQLPVEPEPKDTFLRLAKSLLNREY